MVCGGWLGRFFLHASKMIRCFQIRKNTSSSFCMFFMTTQLQYHAYLKMSFNMGIGTFALSFHKECSYLNNQKEIQTEDYAQRHVMFQLDVNKAPVLHKNNQKCKINDALNKFFQLQCCGFILQSHNPDLESFLVTGLGFKIQNFMTKNP